MYAVINKSGCVERQGNVQVRLDFYLEPDEPRYLDLFIDGQATPFHSHFVYFDPDVTEADIKAEMDFHLPNFYKAFQDRWDKVNGGMRHGWATEKRVPPLDYSQLDSEKNYALQVARCIRRINKLTEFSYKSESREGQEYPATVIDIGSGAIDRSDDFPATYTAIDLTNPANDTGILDTFEVWAQTTMSGINKVGTLDWNVGTNWSPRDYATIGTVTSGAKRTFTGLSINVSTGDHAGIYYSVGVLERAYTGGADIYYKSGDQWDAGQQTYTALTSNAISIYGTGETAVIDYPISISSSLALTSTLSRALASDRGVSPNMSLTASLLRAWTHSVATSASLSLATSLSKSWNRIQTITSSLSLTSTLSKSWARIQTITSNLSLATTVGKSWGVLATISASLGLATTISRVLTWGRAVAVALGLTPQVEYTPTAITQTVTVIGSNSATLEGKISEDAGGNCEGRFRYRIK